MVAEGAATTLIRTANAVDAEALARIYNHYILNTIVTFEEQPIPSSEMAQRISECASASLPWLVAQEAGNVIGYAYASSWKSRCAYRFSVESTVYLEPSVTGRSVGTKLYERLLRVLGDTTATHVVIGGIALPNDASVALHERLGFKKIAHFKEVGFKFERWIDVGYWQLAL